MTRYLKSADRTPVASDPAIAKTVSEILLAVEKRGTDAVREYSQRFDNWSPERFTVSREEIDRAAAEVPDQLREHIDRAAQDPRRSPRPSAAR